MSYMMVQEWKMWICFLIILFWWTTLLHVYLGRGKSCYRMPGKSREYIRHPVTFPLAVCLFERRIKSLLYAKSRESAYDIVMVPSAYDLGAHLFITRRKKLLSYLRRIKKVHRMSCFFQHMTLLCLLGGGKSWLYVMRIEKRWIQRLIMFTLVCD